LVGGLGLNLIVWQKWISFVSSSLHHKICSSLSSCSNRCTAPLSEIRLLTYSEHLNFAEVHPIVAQRELNHDVSVVKVALTDVCTDDAHRTAARYGTRVLATKGVVPQF